MEKDVKDFLDSILAKSTRKGYIRALEVFEKYTGKTISEIIQLRRKDFASSDIAVKRRLDREVERFYVWLIMVEEKISKTAVRAIRDEVINYLDLK